MPGPVRNSGPLITPDEWLRAQLVRVRACNASSAIVDDEMLDTLPAYCARSRDEDLQEYILNILGDQGMATALVAEYLERKRQWAAMGTAGSTPNVWMAREQAQGRDSPHVDGGGSRPSGLRAYMKPRLEDVPGGSARSAEGNLTRFQRRSGGRERGGATDPPSVSATLGAPLPQPASAGRKRRNRAGPAVLGKEAGRRGVCDCQCTRHELVSNCLRCGKIVCEVEGEGPCSYCGALVVREGGEYESVCGQGGELSAERIEAVRKATAFKDRLVEYDRTAAQRTEVIDDQADYFQVDGNAWLTDEEKKRLKKQMEERERAEEEKRRKVVVTFDLIGRKVLVASDGGQADSTSEISAVGIVSGEGRGSGVRMRPNPTLLTPPPIFVDPRKFAPAGAGGARKRVVNGDTTTDAMGQGSEERGEAPATLRLVAGKNRALQGRRGGAVALKAQATGNGLSRLQHDDPVVEAITVGIGGRGEWDDGESVAAFSWDDSDEDERWWSNEEGNGETSEEEDGGWQQPSVRVRGGKAHDEGADGEECQLDPMARGRGTGGDGGREEEERPPVFDLCLPVKDMAAAIQLAPSLLEVKRQERRELNKKYPKEILREGMVLMKGWLDEDQQVEIVKECRRLGMGPGGFYQPRYGDGGRMHLQMMCLGQHWEPRSRAYEAKRTQYDGATPPPIPDMLKRLIVGALSDANDICMSFNATLGKKEKGVKLIPSMQADVCLVNFYDRNGSLGMHQDKDESEQSLADGAPVVSFSIGDSADFTFGVERDIEFASSVLLESGDVLIFGGVSRLIYHGVERIHPGTAPKGLIKETSLRPGRLNLTFRQL